MGCWQKIALNAKKCCYAKISVVLEKTHETMIRHLLEDEGEDDAAALQTISKTTKLCLVYSRPLMI
jgi:hypothetical protein